MSEPTLPADASADAGTKRCRTCDQDKPAAEFYRDTQSPDGRRHHCRDCVNTPCIDCGKPARGAWRRCAACRATERVCVKCDQTFVGLARECRQCQAKVRECVTCGRTVTSNTKKCPRCLGSAKRECVDCGKSFSGTARRCGVCRSTDRVCEKCGKEFRGLKNRCSMCRLTKRTCSSCGVAFVGNTGRCQPCSIDSRECEGCGRVHRMATNRCWTCRATDRPCAVCGRTFKSAAQICGACRWAALPPEERRGRARRMHGTRRARKAGAQILGPVPAALYAAIMAADACVYCGQPPAAVDHIRPLAQGGIEHESNLTPACTDCNGSKGAKLLIEWDPDRVAHGVAHCPKVAAEYERQLRGLALF